MAGKLGCIAGPVASGLVHPLGGSVLVQAEEVGEDGGGELGGEVEEGGAAAGLGVDAECPEPSAERGRGDGAAGQVTGNSQGVCCGEPTPR